ncbi:MAG: hypothetical protein ACKPKO_05370 [Candidatus Fonsibacter sp.]
MNMIELLESYLNLISLFKLGTRLNNVNMIEKAYDDSLTAKDILFP